MAKKTQRSKTFWIDKKGIKIVVIHNEGEFTYQVYRIEQKTTEILTKEIHVAFNLSFMSPL